LPDAALFSVSDKTGAAELARALSERGCVIYATGGTRELLAAHGIDAHDVEEITGFPPLFGGRIKTLHPKLFGAILFDRDSASDRDQARKYAIHPFSTVVVNLYPPPEIDIGGVALLRAAAKNHKHVTVLSHPSQYGEFLAALPNGGLDEAARKRLAIRAFECTAEYDAGIARYFGSQGETAAAELPGALTVAMPLAQQLRYGENPQLRAAFYLGASRTVPEQLHGKGLSYNNLLDLDATLRLLSRAPLGAEFGSQRERFARAVIVKHTVPCGVAQRSTVNKAVGEALAADPVSAYGGILATDRAIDVAAAKTLAPFFLEIVAAPEFAPGALDILRKKRNLRIMRYEPGLPDELQRGLQLRSALGGVLAEEEDPAFARESWNVVSARRPLKQEWHDLALAWDVVRHVKSNGVVIVKDGVTRGICAGQTNRVSAVQIAGMRAGKLAQGAACASDGFFPFADGLEAAAAAGCTAIIAPSGSMRDPEVIAAADRLGVSLVFSSHRYFLH
jgi:phosphoribosylaminoimidazolecarboxamide formyltransferase/IMP cyclohydrolase